MEEKQVRKSYMKEFLESDQSEKVVKEGMEYYLERIIAAINATPAADTPFIAASLSFIAEYLKKNMLPHEKAMYSFIKSTTGCDIETLQVKIDED